MAESTAQVTWTGDLRSGRGSVQFQRGALPAAAVSWAGRTGETDEGTTPEELLAAAHAACFSMAFSSGLARGGHPPTTLRVSATATFDATAVRITRIHLAVSGQVPGLDAAGFQSAAADAAANCPVSKALEGNVEIDVEAELLT